MKWAWLSENEALIIATIQEKSNVTMIVRRLKISFRTARNNIDRLIDKGLLYNIKKFNENEIGLTATGVQVRGLIFKINGSIRK